MAAIAFTYAVWETYAEDVAVELVEHLAHNVSPNQIPDEARRAITDGADSWQLSVHPGWQGLWIERVRTKAKGDDRGSWGMNTASRRNVETLFEMIGIKDALPIAVQSLEQKGAVRLPPKIAMKKDGQVDVNHALDQLISLRGAAVHNATLPNDVRKGHVLWWQAFVSNLYEETDSEHGMHALQSMLAAIAIRPPVRLDYGDDSGRRPAEVEPTSFFALLQTTSPTPDVWAPATSCDSRS